MDVLEELIDPEERIDRQHVERRVADWKQRIDRLYATLSNWLPSEWSASRGRSISFEEELMRRFKVSAEHLPTLVLRATNRTAQLEPRGLWIIGANGRVDLIRTDRHFLIVDRSGAFDEANWQVSSLTQREHERPLDAALLAEMLA